ncbi:uncharacterized protein Fot_35203 [Forsythia ovata]|uniref:Uncharacterized protein n=1 Tax=Forsythia ovata TaxID=205694 RepID=A0ABD1SKV1_9LAMI
MRLLTDEMDNLKKDLEAAESDVTEFSKRSDLANQAQEITAKALAKANAQRERLIDKIAQLDEATEQQSETEVQSVKAGVEDFKNQFEFTLDYENLQAFFVNFGAQQVLAALKGLHPNLDIFAIEADYLAPKEAEDEVVQSHDDEADQTLANGA